MYIWKARKNKLPKIKYKKHTPNPYKNNGRQNIKAGEILI